MGKKGLIVLVALVAVLTGLAIAEAEDRYHGGPYPTLEAWRTAGERNRQDQGYYQHQGREQKHYGPVTVTYGNSNYSTSYYETQPQAVEPVGAYTVGGTLLGLAGGLLTRHPAGIIAGTALGFLGGSIADTYAESQATQVPTEECTWQYDSTGRQYWECRGHQTRATDHMLAPPKRQMLPSN